MLNDERECEGVCMNCGDPLVVREIEKLERLEAENAKLKAEIDALREIIDSVFREAAGGPICKGKFAGYYDTACLRDLCEIGDKLVEAGLWERHPDGYGRRQFYRPKARDCGAMEEREQ